MRDLRLFGAIALVVALGAVAMALFKNDSEIQTSLEQLNSALENVEGKIDLQNHGARELIDRLTQLIAMVEQRALPAPPDLLEPEELSVVLPETIPANGHLGTTYTDFADVPPDLQEKMLPFLMGREPRPGEFDALYLTESGFAISVSTPQLTDPGEREIARLVVELNGDAELEEERFVRDQISSEKFAGVFGSNQEALEAKSAYENATIRQIEPGVYAVIDLSELIASRPDVRLRRQLSKQASESLRKPGRRRKAMNFLWEDSPAN